MKTKMLIEKLDAFAKNYPFPRVQKMMAKMVVALLKLRRQSQFEINCHNISRDVGGFISMEITKAMARDDNNHHMYHFFEIVEAICGLHNIAEEEAAEIESYCESLISKPDNTLEKYLSRQLQLKADEQFSPDDFINDGHKLSIGICNAIAGRYDEKFMFRPTVPIPNKLLLALIRLHYRSSGFAIDHEEEKFVSGQRGSEVLTVAVTNDDNKVLISVLIV